MRRRSLTMSAVLALCLGALAWLRWGVSPPGPSASVELAAEVGAKRPMPEVAVDLVALPLADDVPEPERKPAPVPRNPDELEPSEMTRAELESTLLRMRRQLARARESSNSERALRRKALAASAQRWSPMKAVGPPDAQPDRDDPNAWAPASHNEGVDWLELDYDPPVQATLVRIHEVCSAGAIFRVQVTDFGGRTLTAWSGTDPTVDPGVFEVTLPSIQAPIASVRIHVDTARREGWNEIDAVELVGASRAWASDARASSFFGGK